MQLTWFLRAEAYPLFALSFLAGVVTTVYWTFATSLIAAPAPGSIAFGLTSQELRIVFWTLLGTAGFIGAVGGDLITRFGLKRTIRAICLAMAAAIGSFASAFGSLPVLVLAAVVFGATFILVSGSIGVWSINVFNSRPSAGFGVTFLMFSVGALVGPAIAGACATRVGLVAPFYGIAVGAVIMATLTPRQDIWSASR